MYRIFPRGVEGLIQSKQSVAKRLFASSGIDRSLHSRECNEKVWTSQVFTLFSVKISRNKRRMNWRSYPCNRKCCEWKFTFLIVKSKSLSSNHTFGFVPNHDVVSNLTSHFSNSTYLIQWLKNISDSMILWIENTPAMYREETKKKPPVTDAVARAQTGQTGQIKGRVSIPHKFQDTSLSLNVVTPAVIDSRQFVEMKWRVKFESFRKIRYGNRRMKSDEEIPLTAFERLSGRLLSLILSNGVIQKLSILLWSFWLQKWLWLVRVFGINPEAFPAEVDLALDPCFFYDFLCCCLRSWNLQSTLILWVSDISGSAAIFVVQITQGIAKFDHFHSCFQQSENCVSPGWINPAVR